MKNVEEILSDDEWLDYICRETDVEEVNCSKGVYICNKKYPSDCKEGEYRIIGHYKYPIGKWKTTNK